MFQGTYLQSFWMKQAFEDDAKTMLAKHTLQQQQGEPTSQPNLCCVSVFCRWGFFSRKTRPNVVLKKWCTFR